MTDILPDVKFENFAAARRCLQTTLQSSGAVVREVSIQEDQNGKSKWRVTLSATEQFPVPSPNNFVAVRAKLNQHVPHRGVLSTIMLTTAFSTHREDLWEVTYGIQKVSRIQRALTKVAEGIAKAVPCMSNMPKIRRDIDKAEKLTKQAYQKKRACHFYNLRKSRKTFVKGDTLMPTPALTQEKKKVTPPTINKAPDYEQWDVRSLLYAMKNVTIEDAKNLLLLSQCRDPYNHEIVGATAYISQRCPGITPAQVPVLYNLVAERLRLDAGFISMLTIKSEFSSRVSMTCSTRVQHPLCSH